MTKDDIKAHDDVDDVWESLGNLGDISRALDKDVKYITSLKSRDEYTEMKNWNPKSIEQELREYGGIIGQDAAVKAASIILYNHSEGRSSVNLFCAPTGSGKTEIWRAMQRLYGTHNVFIVDSSMLTAEGWKGGTKISTILRSLPLDERNSITLVFDEFDKILEPQFGSNGTNVSDLMQTQLLKLFDHDEIYLGDETGKGNNIVLDTSNITIVCLGAFQKLMEKKSQNSGSLGFGAKLRQTCDYSNSEITVDDLIDYGMRPELAGRINRIVVMEPLDIKTMVAIAKNEVQKFSEAMDAEIIVDENTLLMLSRIACEKQLGARWIRSQLQLMIDDQIYEHPKAKKYIIGYEPDDSAELPCIE